MFARFSPEAIKAVMLAQQTAREYGMLKVDIDALLYGLVASGALGTGLESEAAALRKLLAGKRGQAQIVALEIPWSGIVESSFIEAPRIADAQGSPQIKPEHLLHVASDYSEFHAVFVDAGINAQAFIEAVGLRRASSGGDPLRRQVRVGARPKKSMREFFTDASIGVVADAVALAKHSQLPQVTPAHLAQVLRGLPGLPPRAVALLDLIALVKLEQAPAPEAEPEIGSLLIEIFYEAKKQAGYMSSDKITPVHFVLAMLSKEDNGLLYKEIVDAMGSPETAHIPPEEKPLLEEDLRVRCTKRLARTLKSALSFANGAPPGLKHLLLALSHEARKSETDFVTNREERLLNIENELGARIEQEQMSPATTLNTDPDTLRRVVTAASLHAQRLNCARLDINHFAIALLDENDDSVDAVVSIFSESNQTDRRALKKRLENCVQFQAGQSIGYQREPGVLINLYDIPGSLKDL